MARAASGEPTREVPPRVAEQPPPVSLSHSLARPWSPLRPRVHGERVHTLHVLVPASAASQTINMSLRVDIAASRANAISTATGSSPKPQVRPMNAPVDARAAVAVVAPTPTPTPPMLPARKRKASKKERGSHEREASAEPTAPPPASLTLSPSRLPMPSPQPLPLPQAPLAVAASPAPSSASPFEKLNTLKMLLDCGHLTAAEYQERKTQIINDLTGTSTARSSKKPSPRRAQLQPIMKTVVPHAPPDFARVWKERAEKLSFDVDTLEWRATATRVKLDLVPFATGQLRNAYFLQEVDDHASPPRLLVAKFSIRAAEPSSYLSDVEMQAVCAHYAALYNEHDPPLRVCYARSWLLKLRDRADLVCSVEEYLPGAYVKYSNNNGFVGKETSSTEERERNTPHAFSHFSFVASDYRLMIVDIQGVNDSYTDPQIHTADGRGFGAGNLGTFGMEKFLESHRCNEVCRWLGLKSINKEYKPGGTAAPEYQMPFGGKIKKSTSRITEERNTFSRSVTVSEAFGGSNVLQAALDHDDDHDPGSSSVSTCATGSSSMLYGQQQPFLPTDVGPTRGRAITPPRRKKPAPNQAGAESTIWLAIQRMLCCCTGG